MNTEVLLKRFPWGMGSHQNKKKLWVNSLSGFKRSMKPNLTLKHGDVLIWKPKNCLMHAHWDEQRRMKGRCVEHTGLVPNCCLMSICKTASKKTWTVNVNEGDEDKQNALKCSLTSFSCRLRETARNLVETFQGLEWGAAQVVSPRHKRAIFWLKCELCHAHHPERST